MLDLVLQFIAVTGLVATALASFAFAKRKAPKMAWFFLGGFTALAVGFALDFGFIPLQDPSFASEVMKVAAVFLFFLGVFELRTKAK